MINHVNKVEKKILESSEVKNAAMKKLIGPEEGWKSHVMREIILQKDGYSPKHAHDWPHINYVVQGEGSLFIDGEIQELSPGSIAYVPSNILHQFRNEGDGEFRFICIVPKEGHQ